MMAPGKNSAWNCPVQGSSGQHRHFRVRGPLKYEQAAAGCLQATQHVCIQVPAQQGMVSQHYHCFAAQHEAMAEVQKQQ